MPADQAQRARRFRGGRTLLAAAAVWGAYRVGKRALKVAVLAGVLAAGVGLAKSGGVDLRGVQRLATCAIPALIAGARELPQLLTQSAPNAHRRSLRVARQLAHCEPRTTPTARLKGRS